MTTRSALRTALRTALRRRGRGETGASLVIMLALLSLLGVLAASMLTVAYASFKTTETTRAVSSRLYGADAGIDLAIQTMRASTTYCPNTAAGTQSLPSQTINGKTIAITCQTLSGSTGSGSGSSWPTNRPLILTGYDDANGNPPAKPKEMFKTSGSTGRSEVVSFTGGATFNAGGFTWAGGSDSFVFSDLDQYSNDRFGKDYCTGDQSGASPGKPTVTGAWTCRDYTNYPVPDPAPTLVVPTALAHAPVVLSGCTILFPGKYDSTNKPTFQSSGRYYLASGVYYFEDASVTLTGEIFGGQPAPGDSRKFTTITPCATDATANAQVPGSASGYGVELVAGGNTAFTLSNNSAAKMELFARQPAVPASEGTAGLSIYAPRTAGTNFQQSTTDALVTGGTSGQMVIHGLVYTPISDLKIWGLPNDEAGNAAIFGGGLVARTLNLAVNASMGTYTYASIPAGTPASARTVVLTATSSASGEAPVTETAVVVLGTSATTPPTISSWRKS